jgi:hypothetical protein
MDVLMPGALSVIGSSRRLRFFMPFVTDLWQAGCNILLQIRSPGIILVALINPHVIYFQSSRKAGIIRISTVIAADRKIQQHVLRLPEGV